LEEFVTLDLFYWLTRSVLHYICYIYFTGFLTAGVNIQVMHCELPNYQPYFVIVEIMPLT